MTSIAQRAMNSPVLPFIYERLWRPIGFTIAAAGRGTDAEQARVDALLALAPDAHVLDVACGPGNTTRRLLGSLGPDGRIVGLDAAPTMVERARRDTHDPRVEYVHGDGAGLPFAEATFDAVTCLGALYLVEDQEAVLDDLVRVLRPGGRLLVLTSCHRGPQLTWPVVSALARPAGLRVSGPDEIVAAFAYRGLVDVRREVSGVMQLVVGTAPERRR
ncbi:tRNA methyltransferase [Paraconexibacter sp. AEG42_29]|uniref:tRNA methyltransferase n=1 Tax=Paraconexibacter sp. AEG42_29 TaxID=2997339 RepID=A0AAU7API1_9ACTN